MNETKWSKPPLKEQHNDTTHHQDDDNTIVQLLINQIKSQSQEHTSNCQVPFVNFDWPYYWERHEGCNLDQNTHSIHDEAICHLALLPLPLQSVMQHTTRSVTNSTTYHNVTIFYA